MTRAAGDRIDRYEIQSLLGRGGVGEVYLARDLRLGRRVALKVLAKTADATTRKRLLREASMVAAFEHPNVVVVYDVGEQDGAPFLAMELVRGSPLRAFVGDTSVPLPRRIRWLTDAARALAAAHRIGVIHRDIKPDNIMIREDGTVKMLDFGVARRDPSVALPEVIEPDPSKLTAIGAAVGTPLYRSPEQIAGEDVDGKSDQFSWGVMAYELLTGEAPWRGTSLRAINVQILERAPPSLRERASDVPLEVEATVLRALAKSAADRFDSLDDAADIIELYAEATRPTDPGKGRGALTSAPEIAVAPPAEPEPRFTSTEPSSLPAPPA